MVDVTEKEETVRRALASGSIRMSREAFDAVMGRKVRKGDVFGVAQTAGIMATKRTGDLIPMCHPLRLTHSAVSFETDEKNCRITVYCETKTKGETGVEMEALTGTATALLTIYDMCKAIDRAMVIEEICLLEKEGGKSGHFVRGEQTASD